MGMNTGYIDPFIDSTHELFSTMLGCPAVRGTAGPVAGESTSRETMALIGLSGMARGMVAMSFPEDTALNMVNRLLVADLKTLDDTVADAIAEMVNIVAGGAKSRLHQDGRPLIELSLPTVLRGGGYRVEYPSRSEWLEVPFDSELGGFRLCVAFEMNDR